MKFRIIFAAIVAALAFTSCEKASLDDDLSSSGKNVIYTTNGLHY